jgi:hypothetical protein
MKEDGSGSIGKGRMEKNCLQKKTYCNKLEKRKGD